MQDITIRLANYNDLDNLRKWKNANKASYFYKKNITVKQQAQWFAGYIERNAKEQDFMYIVEADGVSVGCFGYRIAAGVIDIYNFMLGNKEYKGKGIVSKAGKGLWKHLDDTYLLDITAKVLNTNTDTINWYLKNNWIVLDEFEDHKVLRYEGQ